MRIVEILSIGSLRLKFFLKSKWKDVYKMISTLKKLFSSSIEEKLYRLEFMKDLLIKDIEKRTLRFSFSDEEQEQLVEFATLVTEQLIKNYEQNRELTSFELNLLNIILSNNFYWVRVFLLSDLNDLRNNNIDKELLIKSLIKEGFRLMQGVGYINIEKRVPVVKF